MRFNQMRVGRVAAVGWLFAAVVTACTEKKPSYPGPYGRQVAEVVPKIEAGVGLKFKTPPRVEARSKEQVRAFVLQQFRDPKSLREFNGIEAAYKLLGMVPD